MVKFTIPPKLKDLLARARVVQARLPKIRLPAFRLPRPRAPAGLLAFARRLRPALPAIGLTLLAALAAVGVIWLRPRFVQRFQDFQATRAARPVELLSQAELLSATGRMPEAFTLLRRAIDQAVSPAERAAAGAAMGRLLLKYGRERPNPYAQMARAYLEAAVNMEPRPDRKVPIYRDLLEAAALLDDSSAVLRFCERGLEVADTDADRVTFLLARLDAQQRIGGWPAINRAWDAATAYRDRPEWRHQFDLREAFILEGALTNPEWYDALIAQDAAGHDPVALRQRLFRKAIGIYDRLAGADPQMADECLFRSARLCCAENLFDEARRRIHLYFDNNYPLHNEDIMLLLTRMARLDGNQPQTADLLSLCLERFQWRTRTAPQILELVEAAEAVGHDPEALFYLEEYLKDPQHRSDHPRLLLKAGQLAARLQRHADALKYLKETLNAGADDELYVTTLLAMADVNLRTGDLTAAQNALVTALTRFPYDPRRGRALYQLVDVFSRSDAPLSDILLVTSLAVNVAPNDPAAVAVLMQLARVQEKLGLYPEAQDKYAKVALLRTISGARPADAHLPDIPVSEALLGSARCLLKMDDVARADRVLRELCQVNKVDPIHSVAAYLWASIAMDQKQYQEAKRRLALIDLAHCPPDVRARAQLDGMLIEIALDRRAPELMVDYLKNLAGLDVETRDNYVRRAYDMAFDRVVNQDPPDRIQWFIDRAAEKTDVLPLANWVMRLSARILREEGVPAFIACLERNQSAVGAPRTDAAGDLNALMTLAVSLENTKERVLEQLQ